MSDVDLFVIGGGSGGVRAARLAAESGARVALAEGDRIGGTCVIRGCVPKKLMVVAADFASTFEDARRFGWAIGQPAFDWRRFRAAKDQEIARLERAYRNRLEASGVQVMATWAQIEDAHTIRLDDGQKLRANAILIAVGGRPVIPEFPGCELAISSDEMFELDEFPKRAVVLGGGYIACEFAGILNGLGCDVTQAYRGDQLLRGFDQDIRDHVATIMMQRGIDLQLCTNIRSLSRVSDGLAAEFSDGKRLVCDLVLAATGRHPRTAGLNLAQCGVRVGDSGEVIVNEYSQTSVPSIFAIGDATNRLNLTPAAIEEAEAFVQTVFHARTQPVSHGDAPTAVFSRPEVGSVGMVEAQALTGGPVKVFLSKFRPLAGVVAGREEQMLMKLIVDSASDRILGVHLAGPGSAELIQILAVAVGMGATKADIDRTLAVHPTTAEELVTMRSPARTT